MGESQELEQQPAPEQLESREDELTRRVARWVEGPLVTVAVLICTYYGGSQYGDSHYVSHPLWQNVILWPILLASFVLLIIDRAGHRRKDMPVAPEMSRAERRALRVRRQTPHRRVSRWVARRIIARQEQKGIAS